MSGSESTNLRSLTVRSMVELAIIIVGVLLALAADDWWTNLEEQAEEAEILEAMTQDLVATQELLENQLNEQVEILEDLKALSEGSTGRAARTEDAVFAEMLHNGVWELVTLTVQMSTYDEIQNSGRMRLINDPELRRALAEYDRKLLAATARINDAFQHQQTKLDPYLIAHFQMSQFSPFVLDSIEGVAELNSPSTLRDHRQLLDDEVLQNLIATKYYLLSNAYRFTGELLEGLSKLEEIANEHSGELGK